MNEYRAEGTSPTGETYIAYHGADVVAALDAWHRVVSTGAQHAVCRRAVAGRWETMCEYDGGAGWH